MTIDFERGFISSLNVFGNEIINSKKPIFTLYLRDSEGNGSEVTAFDATICQVNENEAEYSGFLYDIDVYISVSESLGIRVENRTDMLIEWITFPEIGVKPLVKNGGDAKVIFTYNEGAVCEDIELKDPCVVAEYPSKGNYMMFPYMLFGQFMCYQLPHCGLYVGAHDEDRCPKGIDFYKDDDGGVSMFFRHYCGTCYGDSFNLPYPVVLEAYEGDWYAGAELYRDWFCHHLPEGVKKVSENEAIPEWYKDSPLVITYPVRGIHDMDKMYPNALFPYENALPLIDEIAEAVKTRLMVLLMHWEGTAPWAPPYVWPPYGGEEMLHSFADKLHDRKHLLGVYCSGFGYTRQSNLIEEYNNDDIIGQNNLKDAFCASPKGVAEISNICTGQRSGYDICAASEKGRTILDDAYRPLFESKVDYCQILDQNHGGSQYFCYSKQHGHPHAPGKWMTQKMQELLTEWNRLGKGKLFGCESASAEPYIGNLLFSDNRYGLNWYIGSPLPVYSYIYHEYLRNFMGNMVACPFTNEDDTMCARMAYSFAAGDCMTLVLTPDGNLMTNWGNHDFSKLPNKQRALQFAANMQNFYREKAEKFLYDGRMIAPKETECETLCFHGWENHMIEVPAVYTTAWEKDGERVQIFVNHTETAQKILWNGKNLVISPFNAEIMSIDG